MSTYDFSVLESKFAEIVELMPATFDSHEFLLTLAQKYQTEYITSLYAYKDYVNKENLAPFQIVHGAIIQKLAKHKELVKLIRNDKPSKDIFGNSNQCSEWEKVK